LQAVERILHLDSVIYTDSDCWSPLHWAARSGNVQLFKLLREGGVADSTRDTLEPLCSWNSLKLAVFHQHDSLARCILTHVDGITDEHPTAMEKGKQTLMKESPSILAGILSPRGDKHGSYSCDGCFNVSLLRYDIL
jgi:hypothetical protein